MPRYVLLHKLDEVNLAVAPPVAPGTPAAPVAKADVAVSYSGVTEEGHFSFAIPAHDLGTHNQLDAIHVGLYEKPADGTAPVVPEDPAEIDSAPLHYETDTSKVRSAETVIVDATEAPEGHYVALLVLEFAD